MSKSLGTGAFFSFQITPIKLNKQITIIFLPENHIHLGFAYVKVLNRKPCNTSQDITIPLQAYSER